MIAAVVFWIAFALLIYAYLGYPALIGLRALLRPPDGRPRGPLPDVTVVVVAHNEAARIRGRIENLLGLDYPADRLEILIVSDGSTDGTAEAARSIEAARVRVVAFETRRGKPAVLNEVVPMASGEIVVLADARQRFDRNALRALTGPFADPRVGAVSGDLVLGDDGQAASVGQGVGAYRRYESFMRLCESRIDSTIGATGAIYGIRRALFTPVPEDIILDDVLIPMRITRGGHRVLFEPEARAFDRTPRTAREEFRRKARTLAGNFQLLSREGWLWSPIRNRLWFQTMSHKALRLACPALLVATLVSNVALVHRPAYGALLSAQAAFYGAAAIGPLLRGRGRVASLLSVPYAFCLLNGAAVVGAFRFLTASQRVTWDKAERPARPAAMRSRSDARAALGAGEDAA